MSSNNSGLPFAPPTTIMMLVIALLTNEAIAAKFDSFEENCRKSQLLPQPMILGICGDDWSAIVISETSKRRRVKRSIFLTIKIATEQPYNGSWTVPDGFAHGRSRLLRQGHARRRPSHRYFRGEKDGCPQG